MKGTLNKITCCHWLAVRANVSEKDSDYPDALHCLHNFSNRHPTDTARTLTSSEVHFPILGQEQGVSRVFNTAMTSIFEQEGTASVFGLALHFYFYNVNNKIIILFMKIQDSYSPNENVAQK